MYSQYESVVTQHKNSTQFTDTFYYNNADNDIKEETQLNNFDTEQPIKTEIADLNKKVADVFKDPDKVENDDILYDDDFLEDKDLGRILSLK